MFSKKGEEMKTDKAYYNLQDASDIAKVSIQTLRRDIKLNKLTAMKFGRTYIIASKDFNKYLLDRYNTTDAKAIESIAALLR